MQNVEKVAIFHGYCVYIGIDHNSHMMLALQKKKQKDNAMQGVTVKEFERILEINTQTYLPKDICVDIWII